MIFRQEHWYSFSSTGWLDQDWSWSPLYDKLSACGKPLGNATAVKDIPSPRMLTPPIIPNNDQFVVVVTSNGGPAACQWQEGISYTRQYEKCSFSLDCTDQKDCKADIKW